MVVQSYKSKTKQSRLMFIFSSDDFLQAYKRIQYIKQYANYRAKQGEEITVETVKLQNLNDYLKEIKAEKETLLIVSSLIVSFQQNFSVKLNTLVQILAATLNRYRNLEV